MPPPTSPARWAYRAFQALPAPLHDLGDRVLRWRAEREVRRQPCFADQPRRLLIGPLNTAGQAAQWACAARTHLDGVSALSLWAERGTRSAALGYPHDIRLTRAAQLRGQRVHRERLLAASHLLVESGHPLLGDVRKGSILDDLPALREAGVAVALLFHGSELRDLRRHAELYPHSPFAGEWDPRLAQLQTTVERNQALLVDYDGPVLVPTPDMLDFVPGADWLPIAVDVDRFATGQPVLERARPVVLHAPTNPRLKGTAAVEEALAGLERRGLVTYRRLQGVPNGQMPEFVADADIVVDQIVLGNAATLVAESMAAGRLVIAHLAAPVRERLAAHDPAGEPIPVVQADPDTLAEVIGQVVTDRATYQAAAARGPSWSRRNHDGRRSAAVLAPWLGVPPPPG